MRETLQFKIITTAFRKFFDDDGTFLASGLAFGLLFYSVPFTLLTVSALSYTAMKSDTALAWIRRISLNLIPHSSDLFDNFITDVIARRGLLGLFGFIAFLLASSTTYGSVGRGGGQRQMLTSYCGLSLNGGELFSHLEDPH